MSQDTTNAPQDGIAADAKNSSQDAVYPIGAEPEVVPGLEAVSNMSLGEVLQNLRQQAGLDVATLAAVLKVSVRKVQSLEENRIEELPDLVFARGLVSSICRYYKVDPEPVLSLMPAREGHQKSITPPSVQERFVRPHGGKVRNALALVSPKSLLIVLALLAGALVIIFLPRMEKQTAATPVLTTPSPEPLPSAEVAPAVVTTPPASGEATLAPAGNADVATAEANSQNSQVAPAGAASTTSSNTVSAAGVVSPVPVSASGNSTIQFQSTGDSWVNVRQVDQYGKTLKTVFSGMVKAGAPVPVQVEPPYAVTVGRADVMRVQVRGQNYDLTPLTKGNQARFEIKE